MFADYCELSLNIRLPPNKATISLSQTKKIKHLWLHHYFCPFASQGFAIGFVITLKYKLVKKEASLAIINTVQILVYFTGQIQAMQHTEQRFLQFQT